MALGALIVAGSVNHVRVNLQASRALEGRDDVTGYAYYQYGVVPNKIVFDVWDVGYNASPADVFGAFLDFSYEMRGREFDEVILSFKGEQKFLLPGAYFRRVGVERSHANPVYLIRTLPENALKPTGGHAFSKWTGGALGVLSRQMEDVNEMADAWFLDDIRYQ